MPLNSRFIAACLLGVTLSLLLVGYVSATPFRHVIQLSPVVLAFIIVLRRVPWGTYAALPVFLFWLFIMTLIWLFLLGIAHLVSGTFTPIEIALTISIGLCCVVGLAAIFLRPCGASALTRAIAFVIFAALQIAALWLSLQPGIARR